MTHWSQILLSEIGLPTGERRHEPRLDSQVRQVPDSLSYCSSQFFSRLSGFWKYIRLMSLLHNVEEFSCWIRIGKVLIKHTKTIRFLCSCWSHANIVICVNICKLYDKFKSGGESFQILEHFLLSGCLQLKIYPH